MSKQNNTSAKTIDKFIFGIAAASFAIFFSYSSLFLMSSVNFLSIAFFSSALFACLGFNLFAIGVDFAFFRESDNHSNFWLYGLVCAISLGLAVSCYFIPPFAVIVLGSLLTIAAGFCGIVMYSGFLELFDETPSIESTVERVNSKMHGNFKQERTDFNVNISVYNKSFFHSDDDCDSQCSTPRTFIR